MSRIVLIEQDEQRGKVLTRRLRAQGYTVEAHTDPVQGANTALSEPPAAVIADLWMRGISGVQLCRLLQLEPSTSEVPVILRSANDAPRDRFWADRAGAADYVPKGRMVQLVRALSRVVRPDSGEAFFTHLANSDIDIRDRIAAYLDQALFESVVAAEIRSLGACGSFERLFDLFSQFASQVVPYRWLALHARAPAFRGVHANPACATTVLSEITAAVGNAEGELLLIEDEDAHGGAAGAPVVVELTFAGMVQGVVALAPIESSDDNQRLIELLGREVSVPLRMVSLIEESQRLASYDTLTGMYNRRAFLSALDERWAIGGPVAVLLLDIDHFKLINDEHGHAIGDEVLVAMGRLLQSLCGSLPSLASRWGGEEFVITLFDTEPDTALTFAESIRVAVEQTPMSKVHATASVGLTWGEAGEDFSTVIDRADRLMYQAKAGGRNRVCASIPAGVEALAKSA